MSGGLTRRAGLALPLLALASADRALAAAPEPVSIKYVPQMQVVGIRFAGVPGPDLADTMRRAVSVLASLGAPATPPPITIRLSEGDYLCGQAVDGRAPATPPLRSLVLPAARVASAPHRGGHATIGETAALIRKSLAERSLTEQAGGLIRLLTLSDLDAPEAETVTDVQIPLE